MFPAGSGVTENCATAGEHTTAGIKVCTHQNVSVLLGIKVADVETMELHHTYGGTRTVL